MKQERKRATLVQNISAAALMGLGTTFGLGAKEVSAQEGTSWSEPFQFKSQAGNDVLGDPNRALVYEAWNGKDPCSAAQFILPPGVFVRVAWGTDGKVWSVRGDSDAFIRRAEEMGQERAQRDNLAFCYANGATPAIVVSPEFPKIPDWEFVNPDGSPLQQAAESVVDQAGGGVWQEGPSFAIQQGEFVLAPKDNNFLVSQVWDGKNPNSIVIFVVTPGSERKIASPVSGSTFLTKASRDEVIARVKQMQSEIQKRDNLTQAPRAVWVQPPDLPDGFSADGVFQPAQQAVQPEAAKPQPQPELKFDNGTAISEQERATLRAETGRFVVAIIWDGKNVRSTKVVAVEGPTAVGIPGPVLGTKWNSESGTKDQVAARIKQMLEELKKQNPNLAGTKAFWAGKTAAPAGIEKAPGDVWNIS